MSRWAPVVAGGALVAVLAIAFLRAPERGSGDASAMGGEEVERAGQPLAFERPVVEDSPVDDSELRPVVVESEAADPAGREARVSAGPERTTIRGRVVDAHTGAPVPEWLGLGVSLSTDAGKRTFLGALFGRRLVKLGPDGSFEVTSARPERLAVTVVESTTGIELERGTVHLYSVERAPDGAWRVPLGVGWLARLELATGARVPLRLEAAGLVEVIAGAEQEWSGAELLRRDVPLVLFRKADFEEDRGHARWLDVVAVDDEDRRFEGRVAVTPVNGVQPAPIAVDLRSVVSLRGRVVDENGEPWAGAIVELLAAPDRRPRDRAGELWQASDRSGAFGFSDCAAGEHRLRVSAGFACTPVQTVSLRVGENDLGVVVLHRGGRGTVRGSLVSEETDSSGDPFALLELRDPRTATERMQRVGGFEAFGRRSDGQTSFEFPDVPAGRYQLEVVALDGRDYGDTPLEIQAPCDDLVIRSRAPEGRLLRVVDGPSREPLELEAMLALRGDRWFPVWAPVIDGRSMVLAAAKHRPLRVDSADTSGPELEVALERGWGRIVLVREVGAGPLGLRDELAMYFSPPVAGARVLADGIEIARSDATGLALLALERAPARVDIDLDGYRALHARVEDQIQIVLMMRE